MKKRRKAEEKMNIEIANRLVQLRKSNNLSQEALAEKLGISRQAVSKWERAEASPDTDNLILLARLYGVSLDELLSTEDEIPMPEAEASFQNDYTEKETHSYNQEENAEYVHIGLNGIHVKDEDDEVHIGWNGIHVTERGGDNVHIDKNGVYVNGERKDKEWISHHAHFPIAVIVIIAYIMMGICWNAWHPGWLVFFMIPIWHSLIEAVEHKDAHRFAYPVLVVLAYLCMGFFWFSWHPGWVLFLTIPLYYSLISYFKALAARRKMQKSGETQQEESGAYEEQ